MKYSFCYTLKKIVEKEDSSKIEDGKFFFEVKDGSVMLMECGPWRSTKDEVKQDEALYHSDPDAFFSMVKNKNGT